MRLRILGLGLAVMILAAPLGTEAQQPGKVTRVGWLSLGSATSDEAFLASFRDALRELGWVVGTNIAIESRRADPANPIWQAAALRESNQPQDR